MGHGDGDGDARRRRRGADTSYQRDDDVTRPSTEQSTRRGMVGWYSVVSVANPFGVGGSGGGVLAPWWSFHTLVVGAAVIVYCAVSHLSPDGCAAPRRRPPRRFGELLARGDRFGPCGAVGRLVQRWAPRSKRYQDWAVGKKALTKLVSCTSCAGALTLIR